MLKSHIHNIDKEIDHLISGNCLIHNISTMTKQMKVDHQHIIRLLVQACDINYVI